MSKDKQNKNKTVDLRQQILSKDDIRKEKIYIDVWDCELLIKGLSGEERNEVLSENIDPETRQVNIKKAYPELIIKTTYNPETGKRIFKMSDRSALVKKSGEALEQIAQKAMKLSGISPEQMEETEKN